MPSIAHVPEFDVEPEGGHEPRRVAFEAVTKMGRRGFMGVLAAGGMALGLTALSWIPVGRRARASAGSEYYDCNIYSYEDQLCVGAPYGPHYCGDDKWFKNGCFQDSDGNVDCYRPIQACNDRNAWRWDGWRCADGEVQWSGTDSWLFYICSAAL